MKVYFLHSNEGLIAIRKNLNSIMRAEAEHFQRRLSLSKYATADDLKITIRELNQQEIETITEGEGIQE